MKLEFQVYPDFYKIKAPVLQEKCPELFVGRRIELESFWRCIYRIANYESVNNRAIISHRKMGKTALLTHFYHLAFWE